MKHTLRPIAIGVSLSCLAVFLVVSSCESSTGLKHRASFAHLPDELPDADLQRGGALYARYCSVCHGRTGAADGEGSAWLFPPARDFTRGNFRLVSTANGAPTDLDLVRVLRRGMPGSAMPSWEWLEEGDLYDLAAFVRFLAVEGAAERIERQARDDGEPMRPGDALELASSWLTPDKVLEPIDPVEPTVETLAVGERLYVANCAGCHGKDGRGFDEHPRWNEDGTLNWARDFTKGYMKGGATHADLFWRIRTGLAGTPMGATPIDDPEEMAALVAYVRGMIRPGAEERLVQTQQRLRVRRAIGGVPTEPGDPRWNQSEQIILVLAPLGWDTEAVFTANLSAMHDGETISIRLRWPDPTEDGSVLSGSPYPDGCALQLSGETAPPLFGMGSHARPVNIWHWQAFRTQDVAGAIELMEKPMHTVRDLVTGEVSVMDAPFYLSAPGVIDPSDEGSSLSAEGVRSAERFGDERALDIQARPAWKDGVWEVVFTRDMAPRTAREEDLAAGYRVLAACAIWNGSAEDTSGKKSISIWHELMIDP